MKNDGDKRYIVLKKKKRRMKMNEGNNEKASNRDKEKKEPTRLVASYCPLTMNSRSFNLLIFFVSRDPQSGKAS